MRDVRFALRQLAASPGFACVAILTLALAMAASTAIFSAVDAVFLHPLPYPDPDRLVIVQEDLPRFALRSIAATPQDFVEFRREATSFSYIAGINETDAALSGDGNAEFVTTLRISAAAFPMLNATPLAGGLFTSDAEQPGRDRVVVISEGLWTRRYGRDPSIVGRNIQINRENYRVLGVIHPILDYRVKPDLWIPLAFAPAEVQPGTRGPHYIDVVGRLKNGVSFEQARQEFAAIAARIVKDLPDQASMDRGFALQLQPLAEKQAGDLKAPLLVLTAAVLALMLIACANVSNLLLARGMARRREFSIRAALGAGRARIVRQLLTESLILGLAAAVVGTLLAYACVRGYQLAAPASLIHGVQPSINVWVAAFSLLIAFAASVIFGLAPSLDTSRVNVAASLKENSRTATGGRTLLRESMVAFEIAVSLVLLIGAGLFINSFVRLARTSPGFDPSNILTASVSLPANDYPQPAQRAAFARTLLERAAALPGVRSAATVDFIPYNGGPGSATQIIGRVADPHEPTQVIYQTRTSPGYFKTLGIPLLRGRDIRPSDEQGSPPVAIIDETVAKRFFPDRDPIGMQMSLPLSRGIYTIIGVAATTKSRNLAEAPLPRLYYSGPQVPFPSVALLLKTDVDPLSLASAVRREIRALDANLPVDTLSMTQILADSVARQKFAIELMASLAAIAAILTVIGIYGVLAYLVDQRRREFGIRIALGAGSGQVLSLVLAQGSIPVATGLIAGIAAALGFTRFIKSLLYQTSPTDPVVFIAISGGLVLVALLAMLIPARWAMRVDPAETLRQE
jgi:putative ABC transport system permease protein